ncbi:DnaJ domain-containing protein [Pedobacter sp. GR22-6]|uniref:DnaJ domain-containing protein n=1 Tax=Pedobacter sp. GR22-6 TaxID=3127957 RepID=UPI00307E4169
MDIDKKGYRSLVRKYHPDLNPNDHESNKVFQQINEASEDDRKRQNRRSKC